MIQPDKENPVQEPWQAQALAAAFSLQEAGIISAKEWSNALGAAIRRAQAAGDPGDGESYYYYVLDALETLLGEKNLIEAGELSQRKAEWQEAYRSTPHGQPIRLVRK